MRLREGSCGASSAAAAATTGPGTSFRMTTTSISISGGRRTMVLVLVAFPETQNRGRTSSKRVSEVGFCGYEGEGEGGSGGGAVVGGVSCLQVQLHACASENCQKEDRTWGSPRNIVYCSSAVLFKMVGSTGSKTTNDCSPS